MENGENQTMKNEEEESNNETIEESTLQIHSIVKLQSYLRKIRARKQIVDLLQTRYEKIYDPKRKKCFYYDIVRDISSWKKPKLLKDNDINKISSLYTPNEAAIIIQRQVRKSYALKRVRMLYQKRIKIQRISRHKTAYYNKVTKETLDRLPNFMAGRLDYDYEINLGNDKAKKKKKNESESDESDEDDDDDQIESQEDEDEKSSESDSSSVIREKRIAARVHPRYVLSFEISFK